MKDIDIVVTYLDSSKENWVRGYKEREEEEIREGIQERSNRQAFGEERNRDWSTLRYWLRGVEANCDWIRNVIITVYDKKQVPEWLNLENSRIRVVEHKEFMPKDILPCYNGQAVKFYISNIEGLSERYIISDDDQYFINRVEKEMYFKGSKTVQIDATLPYREFNERYLKASDGVFYATLNNNLRYEEKYMCENKIKYYFSHMPEARDRLYEQEIIKRDGELFKNPFKISRFRHKNQYTSDIFTDLLRIEGKCVLSSEFKEKCKYVTLKSTVDFTEYKDYLIVCFNDTEQLDDFKGTQKKLLEFLDMKLPNKCSFEK